MIVRARLLATRPRVSVVVPLYNYGRFLPELVAGLVHQDAVDVDVLIVDDASTDDDRGGGGANRRRSSRRPAAPS